MTVTLFITILLALLANFGFFFFKAYFTERGKKVATKEDLEEMTSKVEAIKTEFTKEIERLKISLQFENTIKATIFTDRKQAVIETYEAMHLWFHTLDDEYTKSITYTPDQLNSISDLNDKLQFAFNTSNAKLHFYVNDPDLTETIFAVQSEIMTIHENLVGYVIEMRPLVQGIDECFVERQTATGEQENEIIQRGEELMEKRLELYRSTYEKTKPTRMKLLDFLQKFRNRAFEIVTQTEEEALDNLESQNT